MNSGVSNCIEVRKFWEYLTDLRQIFLIEIKYFFEKFLSISFRIRIVSNRPTSISVEVYEYCRYLLPTHRFSWAGAYLSGAPHIDK